MYGISSQNSSDFSSQNSGRNVLIELPNQEIVFIGHGMKSAVIQDLLDQCLLTDEEMALGPNQWKETFQHLDNFNLVLEEEDFQPLDNVNLALEEHEEFLGEDKEEGKQGEKFWGKGEEEEDCKKRCELSGCMKMWRKKDRGSEE